MFDIETSLSSLEPLIGPQGSNRDFQPAFPNASFQSFPGRGQDLEICLDCYIWKVRQCGRQ